MQEKESNERIHALDDLDGDFVSFFGFLISWSNLVVAVRRQKEISVGSNARVFLAKGGPPL